MCDDSVGVRNIARTKLKVAEKTYRYSTPLGSNTLAGDPSRTLWSDMSTPMLQARQKASTQAAGYPDRRLSGSRWMRLMVSSNASGRFRERALSASSISPAVGFLRTVRRWRTGSRNLHTLETIQQIWRFKYSNTRNRAMITGLR